MAESKAPSCSYLVCATQRSGSTFLCEALARTGVAGKPEEYFEAMTDTLLPQPSKQWFRGLEDHDFVRGLSDEWGPPHTEAMSALAAAPSYSDYLDWVLAHGTTANGIFGAKMMWSYLHDFVEQTREIPAYAGLPVHTLLARAFPSLRYLWVTRRDKVRQAVSMWKALQTETWRAQEAGQPSPPREAVFDFEAIEHLKRRMADHDAAWCAYFFRSGIQPLTIVYEDFESDYLARLRRILEHLGVPVAADTIPPPPTARQADTRSEEWIAEYRRLEDERAASPPGARRLVPLYTPASWPPATAGS